MLEAYCRLSGGDCSLVSVMNESDESGLHHLRSLGVRTESIQGVSVATPTYMAVLDHSNDLHVAIADFSAMEQLDLVRGYL